METPWEILPGRAGPWHEQELDKNLGVFIPFKEFSVENMVTLTRYTVVKEIHSQNVVDVGGFFTS